MSCTIYYSFIIPTFHALRALLHKPYTYKVLVVFYAFGTYYFDHTIRVRFQSPILVLCYCDGMFTTTHKIS